MKRKNLIKCMKLMSKDLRNKPKRLKIRGITYFLMVPRALTWLMLERRRRLKVKVKQERRRNLLWVSKLIKPKKLKRKLARKMTRKLTRKERVKANKVKMMT
jgi:hypothetical protein